MSVGVEENRGRTRSTTALPHRCTVQTWEGAGFVQTTIRAIDLLLRLTARMTSSILEPPMSFRSENARKEIGMSEAFEYGVVEFIDCLKTGFVDASVESDARYTPKILVNDVKRATNVLSALKNEMRTCERFDLSVAFITSSGVQALVQILNTLREENVPGRILTTTYLNFSEPDALRKLGEYPNIETRIYQGNMHAKGYFFKQGEINTVIIGSANITQSALTSNKEWNVLFHSFDDGDVLQAARSEFDALWNAPETIPSHESWIAEYEDYRHATQQERTAQKDSFSFGTAGTSATKNAFGETRTGSPSPNAMQKSALKKLKKLHENMKPRALLISATGTGKTYLSAFDVKESNPQRILFVAHRERILEASEKSYRNVLGARYTYGIFAGRSKQANKTCLFAMVGTLANNLDKFDRDAFDYIVIDEAHRSGAESYRRIIDYFKPDFLLGMTATPTRTDGYDLFRLYNHTIAHQITLYDALKHNMLTPFHYFGIADLDIDGRKADDLTLFSKLASEDRVSHIIDKIETYSVSQRNRRGLIFCSRNDEAKALSEAFNKRGYRTAALSGANSDADRDRAIELLEQGDLEYIFSVDIFNEGIDIPSLNQIIMLRATQSAIVFVQQLGRGLRKDRDKEYTLVLDFIGNYQTNYLIPIALSEDKTYDKDNLRAFVKEGSTVLPGCSTLNFDRISEARVLRSIDAENFSNAKLLKDEYKNLRHMLGRVPSLKDFDESGSVDPLLILEKYGSYHAFLLKYENSYSVSLSKTQSRMLSYVSQKLASGKRPIDLVLLRQIILHESASERELLTEFAPQSVASALSMLTNQFTLSAQKKSFECCLFAERQGGNIVATHQFLEALKNNEFKRQLLEVVAFGLDRNQRDYRDTYRDTNLVLFKKYTLEDVCMLLNWERNEVPLNVGGYKFDKGTNTFPVFINYNKDPHISETIKYEDRFVSDRELIAISKQPRTLESPEIKRLASYSKNNMKAYLFVRKDKTDGNESKKFYFLGEIIPTGLFRQITMPGTPKPAVEITYRLDVPVRADLYDYLTNDLTGQTDL